MQNRKSECGLSGGKRIVLYRILINFHFAFFRKINRQIEAGVDNDIICDAMKNDSSNCCPSRSTKRRSKYSVNIESDDDDDGSDESSRAKKRAKQKEAKKKPQVTPKPALKPISKPSPLPKPSVKSTVPAKKIDTDDNDTDDDDDDDGMAKLFNNSDIDISQLVEVVNDRDSDVDVPNEETQNYDGGHDLFEYLSNRFTAEVTPVPDTSEAPMRNTVAPSVTEAQRMPKVTTARKHTLPVAKKITKPSTSKPTASKSTAKNPSSSRTIRVLASDKGQSIYHMINGFPVDLNSAAEQNTIRLPNGKVIHVRKKETHPRTQANSMPSRSAQRASIAQPPRAVHQPIARRSTITVRPTMPSVAQSSTRHSIIRQPNTAQYPPAGQFQNNAQFSVYDQRTMRPVAPRATHPQMSSFALTGLQQLMPPGMANGMQPRMAHSMQPSMAHSMQPNMAHSMQQSAAHGMSSMNYAVPIMQHPNPNALQPSLPAPSPHLNMIPKNYDSTPVGKSRTKLEQQIFNGIEVCRQIEGKFRTLMNSNAYKTAKSLADVKELHIHMSYLLTFTLGRFKTLEEKCMDGMRNIGFHAEANLLKGGDIIRKYGEEKDDNVEDLEIVEPQHATINLDSDDEEPMPSPRKRQQPTATSLMRTQTIVAPTFEKNVNDLPYERLNCEVDILAMLQPQIQINDNVGDLEMPTPPQLSPSDVDKQNDPKLNSNAVVILRRAEKEYPKLMKKLLNEQYKRRTKKSESEPEIENNEKQYATVIERLEELSNEMFGILKSDSPKKDENKNEQNETNKDENK